MVRDRGDAARPVGEVPAAALDHRRFWDAMDAVSPEQLTEIERQAGQAARTGSAWTCPRVLDMTNFATFIDTGNEKAPIAQRGKAKQKRHDLRLVGLALVVTRDGGVPVVSRAYPGNRPDVALFTAVVDQLGRRCAVLAAARRRADRRSSTPGPAQAANRGSPGRSPAALRRRRLRASWRRACSPFPPPATRPPGARTGSRA